MSVLNLFAFAGHELIVEEDETSDSTEFAKNAQDLLAQHPECDSVVILRDDVFVFDTNDVRH
jgi:hypothetical protein